MSTTAGVFFQLWMKRLQNRDLVLKPKIGLSELPCSLVTWRTKIYAGDKTIRGS
jgi:hypothetical protein